MKTRLERLTLKNFKGIQDFELDLRGGKSASIYGDNGVGKTTLKNAYLWCLTGRDSDNRTDHEIRPYDKDNNVIHHLNSIVEMVLSHDEGITTLKRLYKERWSRKTGDVEKTYDGNTTDLFINDVKVKKGEYEREVAKLLKPELIQLLSDPTYFTGLKWQDQRDYLFSLIDISDEDVVAENSELEGFTEKYNTSMLDAEKKQINSKRREIEQDIASNDAKLEENLNSLGEPKDWDNLVKSLEAKKEELSKVKTKIEDSTKSWAEAQKKASDEYLKKYSALNEELVALEKELQGASVESKAKHNEGLDKLRKELALLNKKKSDIESSNNSILESNNRKSTGLERLANERSRYLKEYK
ncbi:MAG: AAA family ATPase, partial [Bacteroides sp.]